MDMDMRYRHDTMQTRRNDEFEKAGHEYGMYTTKIIYKILQIHIITCTLYKHNTNILMRQIRILKYHYVVNASLIKLCMCYYLVSDIWNNFLLLIEWIIMCINLTLY